MTAWATNPQAAQIDALIERAARLTSVECERLIEARRPVWNKAGIAARDSARAAARAAAWFATRDTARAAARSAVRAWFVAQDASAAAEALVVRDLIDETTDWNRAAYDVVTSPWRRVVGPIHPDDEVLR